MPFPDQSTLHTDSPEEGGQDSWHKRQSTPEKKQKIPVVPREVIYGGELVKYLNYWYAWMRKTYSLLLTLLSLRQKV